MKEIGTLLVHGGEVGAEGAEGIGAALGSEAAGDFLFDLGHAHGLFSEIVGERNIVVGGESPDIVGIKTQAEQEVGRLALSRSTALAGFRGEWIDGFTGDEDLVVTSAEIGEPICRQRASKRIDLVARGDQQVDHAARPGLVEFLEDVGQFAQVMGIAQPVFAEQLTIRFPAIVDKRTQEAGQDRQGIERLSAPLRMASDPGQHPRGQNVHPVQRTGDTHPRFIRVGDVVRLNGLTDQVDGGLQANPRLFAGSQNRRIGHRQPEEIAHQGRRAAHRHHVMMSQMDDSRQYGRAILHRRNYAVRKRAPANLAASALRGQYLMLGDIKTQRRKIEYLSGFDNPGLGQKASA